MFKLLIFARRLPDMSRELFVQIYETSHIALVNRLVEQGLHAPMRTYRRNYLVKDHPLTGPEANVPCFDVVVESCFEDEEDFQSTLRLIAESPGTALAVQEDFAKFLDLSSLCYCVVDVHEGGGGAKHAA